MAKKLILAILLLSFAYIFFWNNGKAPEVKDDFTLAPTIEPTSNPTPTSKPAQPDIPTQKILPNDYHVYQTFNNCGPAALSMALSYYGVNESQETLGQDLRPYQNPQGDNDDKSVTLEELAEKSREYDLIPYHLPNGSIKLIRQMIANEIPVITRTLLTPNEDIGHYRVVKGYDDVTQELIQDDSLQGKNLRYTYDLFSLLWKQFNYEYLVMVPPDKKEVVDAILGENVNPKVAWKKAADRAESELSVNPNDIYAQLNLSVAYYNIGEYQNSVTEFEKVETLLPFRTLWYQTEPIEAYFEIGDYDKVVSMIDSILNNYNRAFSELYILRGKIYREQGNEDAAKVEFDKAIFYNRNIEIPTP